MEYFKLVIYDFIMFILQEDVDSFMKRDGNDFVEVVLKRLDELYSKYKFMEYNFSIKKVRYVLNIKNVKLLLSVYQLWFIFLKNLDF